MANGYIEVSKREPCPICGTVLKKTEKKVCLSCRRKLSEARVTEPACARCGKPLEEIETEYCVDCEKKRESMTFYVKGQRCGFIRIRSRKQWRHSNTKAVMKMQHFSRKNLFDSAKKNCWHGSRIF